MKSLKNYISVILSVLLILCIFAGCGSVSLVKPTETTTKEAFDEEAFNEEYYRTYTETEPESEETSAEEADEEDVTSVTEASTETTTLAEKAATIASTIASTVSSTAKSTTKATTKATTKSSIFKTTTKATTTQKTVVDTKREEKVTKSDYKYGIVKIDTVATYYDVYSDGSKVQSSQKSYTDYDSSKYKAKTSEILDDAKANKTANASTASALVSAINSYRKDQGKSTLTADDSLATAAAVRATEMAYKNALSSTRPDGSKYSTVLSDLDIEFTNAIELTGSNFSDADSALSSWKGKSSAKAALLSSDYNKVGVGIATNLKGNIVYWCVIFTN